MKSIFILLLSGLFCTTGFTKAQKEGSGVTGFETEKKNVRPGKIFAGTASYYADKFVGRQTASGEEYGHHKLTAACNVLPMGTWIRVTNLKNKRRVVVQVNDRLHPKNKRIVDLSYSAAQRLGYVRAGLAPVEVEVLDVKKAKK